MNRIKELRVSRGESQEKIAELLGVKAATISRYESGDREPDNFALVKLSDYFDVSTDYLLGRTENPSPIDAKKPAQEEINLDELEFALFGEVRELNDEEKEELLRMARRMRELDELKREKERE